MAERRQVLAMIASALNRNEDESYYRDLLDSVDATPARDGLILTMVDGTRFKIVPEVV